MSGPEDNGERGGGSQSPMALIGVGAELVVPVIVALYVGYRLDLWLETEPLFVILGAVLGIVAGFAQFLRRVLPRKPDGGGGSDGERGGGGR